MRAQQFTRNDSPFSCIIGAVPPLDIVGTKGVRLLVIDDNINGYRLLRLTVTELNREAFL